MAIWEPFSNIMQNQSYCKLNNKNSKFNLAVMNFLKSKNAKPPHFLSTKMSFLKVYENKNTPIMARPKAEKAKEKYLPSVTRFDPLVPVRVGFIHLRCPSGKLFTCKAEEKTIGQHG